MKPVIDFDFREFLGGRRADMLGPKACHRLVLGAAACEQGLALVALCEGELADQNLDCYAHVVLGPIEDDWEHIAKLIDQLREILEPPVVSCVLLRLGPGPVSWNVARIFDRLKRVFPTELRTVCGDTVDEWAKVSPCKISLPNISEDERWIRELLLSAAKTALFAENAAVSLGRPDDPGSSAGSQDGEAPHNDIEEKSASSKAKPDAGIAPSPLFWNSPAATAINFTNPFLYIATVRSDTESGFVLDEERTLSMELRDRTAEGLLKLQSQLKDLFESWQVNWVAMRVGGDKGPYQLRPNAYKIEAALQLLDSIDLREVSVAEVAGFARKYDHLLPAPQSHLKQKAFQAGQRNAIRAACLALHRIEQGGG
jgi:hypothetical protein